MALARLALKNLQQRVSSSLPSHNICERTLGNMQKQRWGSDIMKRFATTDAAAPSTEKASDVKSDGGREVAVAEGGKKSKLFPRKQRKNKGFWRSSGRDFVPALSELFPSSLGNALAQATENMQRLFENLAPSRFMGQVKEQDECYKLRYEVPGLSKEDLKITVEDGFLTIKGEHKEEEEDDEYWYGYYNTSLMLPPDAKVDEIKAELKDGVLTIIIPRTEKQEREVKEVQIH